MGALLHQRDGGGEQRAGSRASTRNARGARVGARMDKDSGRLEAFSDGVFAIAITTSAEAMTALRI